MGFDRVENTCEANDFESCTQLSVYAFTDRLSCQLNPALPESARVISHFERRLGTQQNRKLSLLTGKTWNVL